MKDKWNQPIGGSKMKQYDVQWDDANRESHVDTLYINDFDLTLTPNQLSEMISRFTHEKEKEWYKKWDAEKKRFYE